MDIAGCWRYSRGFVGGFISGLRQPLLQPTSLLQEPDLADPEVLLDLAHREMKEAQAKNRGRTVQAITQKNNLRAHIERAEEEIDILQVKADAARLSGNLVTERQFLAEKLTRSETIVVRR